MVYTGNMSGSFKAPILCLLQEGCRLLTETSVGVSRGFVRMRVRNSRLCKDAGGL